jgi:predicted PurR-regulated permease PerM
MERPSLGKASVLALTLGITALFFAMIRSFVVDLLLAAIFAGLFHPLYRRLERSLGGRSHLASAVTLTVLLLVVIVPVLAVLGMVAAQAVEISRAVRPFVEEQLSRPDPLGSVYERLPFLDEIGLQREVVLQKVGGVVQNVGSFFVESLTGITTRTAGFFFHFFLFLYSMFFFLVDGGRALRRMLHYLPLDHEDEMKMVGRFVSVSRATLKGTLVIGLVQGTLGGAAFAVAGLSGSVFWGALMVILSIIPGVGTALVWIPGAVILAASGRPVAAALMAVWFAAVVGTMDNLLRPRLVGKDTQMHELLILFSTLGGLALFGIPGFLLGPIVAALFMTMWDIYAVVFSRDLPEVRNG